MDKSIVLVNQLAVRSSTCYEFSNPTPAEVVEIEDEDASVVTVEKQMEELKLNYQFNEKDVPPVFKFLINCRINRLKVIMMQYDELCCQLLFDDVLIIFAKKNDDWTVTYEQINTTTMIESVDPMKFMIDHLWFVLKNPNIKLEVLEFIGRYYDPKAEQRQKLDTLLQAMSDTFDHQIQTRSFVNAGFNEDTFFSLLKHIKPRTLEKVGFRILWKEEGNYRKLEEIVEMDQWKQAKRISSSGVTPFKIDDFLQYESFCLHLDNVTPNDVLRTSEHVLNSAGRNNCILSCEKLDIDAIMDVFRSQNDVTQITQTKLLRPTDKFSYKIVKSGKCLDFYGTEKIIVIRKI